MYDISDAVFARRLFQWLRGRDGWLLSRFVPSFYRGEKNARRNGFAIVDRFSRRPLNGIPF